MVCVCVCVLVCLMRLRVLLEIDRVMLYGVVIIGVLSVCVCC